MSANKATHNIDEGKMFTEHYWQNFLYENWKNSRFWFSQLLLYADSQYMIVFVYERMDV